MVGVGRTMILTTIIWIMITIIMLSLAFLETLIWMIVVFIVWLIAMLIALLIDGIRFGYIGIKRLWRMLIR